MRDGPRDERRSGPAVSVIVPAWNDERYIAECLDSVLAQTFADWEAVCIDDGSSDGSLSIFQEYARRDARIRVMSQENLGVVAARNRAIAAARGEYILPLDSDDMLAPDCIELLHGYITTRDCAVACPAWRNFGEGWPAAEPETPEISKWNMYRLCNAMHNTSLYPKRLWEKYGGYDHLFDGGMEDLDFWLNFIDDGQKAVRVPGACMFYRQKPGLESREKRARADARVRRRLRAALCRKHPRARLYRPLHRAARLLLSAPRFFSRFPFYAKRAFALIWPSRTSE